MLGGQAARIDLTFAASQEELFGNLMTPQGEPSKGHSIVVFPEDRELWPAAYQRVRATRPASNGDFRVRALMPGVYRLAVVDDLRSNEWYLPGFLGTIIQQSIPISVSAGIPTRVNLLSQK
jgi:hypothetical protein